MKCYDHFLQSIEVAKKLGERPDIFFTVHSGNIQQIAEVYDTITRPNDLVLILNPIFEYNDVRVISIC